MRDFFDEQGRTRVFARGVLEVRRGQKPAENAAHRKNSHLWMETNLQYAPHQKHEPESPFFSIQGVLPEEHDT